MLIKERAKEASVSEVISYAISRQRISFYF